MRNKRVNRIVSVALLMLTMFVQLHFLIICDTKAVEDAQNVGIEDAEKDITQNNQESITENNRKISNRINMPVKLMAEDGNLRKNLQNGSFEQKELYKTYTGRTYIITGASNVDKWNTTATDNQIEIAWLKEGSTQPHMLPIKVGKAADGQQFVETVANESSSLYQEITLSDSKPCTVQFSHRGRSENSDTVAMIIGPRQQYSFNKTQRYNTNDPFMKMVSWIKASTNITAPENGKAVSVTVYSTKLSKQSVFAGESDGRTPFSLDKDDEHTEKWQVWLLSSNKYEWNTLKDTYTPEEGKTDLVMAFSVYYSASKNNDVTSGNLLDAISFKDGNGNEKITQSSFEDISFSGGYKNVFSANVQKPYNPEPNIGWSTTATNKTIEVGRIGENGSPNAYGLSLTQINDIYIRDGQQFAELNANQESTLYQYVDTLPGMKYEWSLSHRGRSGMDTMALVIGPKQQYNPKKTSAQSRDQLMQIVYWLKNQPDVIIENNDKVGCSQKITMFTSKFNNSGGFEGNSPFSWAKDDEHTEKWNIWIISSDNYKWYDYGKIDPNVKYDYSYVVPKENPVSIFGFVSFESAANSLSVGNLLDYIHFDPYYYVQADTTPNGTGTHEVNDEQNAEILRDTQFSAEQHYSGWALSDSQFRIVAKNTANRNFLGGIINGTFVPEKDWQTSEDGTRYYDVNSVEEHYNIRLIFSAEHVVYDVNGGDAYHYNKDDLNTGYEVPLRTDSSTYTSHAAEQTQKEGWKFIGWQYTDPQSRQYLFDAVHTINYHQPSDIENKDSLSIVGKLVGQEDETHLDGISANDGITMVAQWRYRQRTAVQIYNAETKSYDFSEVGGKIDKSISSKDDVYNQPFVHDGKNVGQDDYVSDDNTEINLLAKPETGYRFVGWYDETGNLVSQSRSYTYRVEDRLVNTLYARFDPEGNNLNITKTVQGVGGDKNSYFAFDISLEHMKENTAYKINGITTTTVSTLDNKSVKNKTSFTADENGNADITVYLKHGETAVIHNLPSDVTYSVKEHDYSSYNYKTEGNVQNQNLNDNQSVNVVNNSLGNLQVTKNFLQNTEDPNSAQPLSGAGFTLYSDKECTQKAFSQQKTGTNGTILFKALNTGSKYYLKETFVPTGFSSDGKVYTISVKDDGIYVNVDGQEKKLTVVNSNTYNITLTNTKMIAIPQSGSAVTPIDALMFGIIILASANAILLYTIIKDKRREKQ